MNTFKDSRKSGDDTQKEPEERVDDRVKKGDFYLTEGQIFQCTFQEFARFSLFLSLSKF